jgi:hypothetical protein
VALAPPLLANPPEPVAPVLPPEVVPVEVVPPLPVVVPVVPPEPGE